MCLPSPLDLYLLCNWSPCLYSTSTAFIFYFDGGDDDDDDLHIMLKPWPGDDDGDDDVEDD